MARFIVTNKAVEDLTNIWNYTFVNWSENQADIYYKLIIESFQEIAKNPKIGKHYSIVEKDIMGYKVNKHIVFYRLISEDENTIEITRILHSMMDIKLRIK